MISILASRVGYRPAILRNLMIAAGFFLLTIFLVALWGKQPLFAIAALYVIIYETLAWRRPDIALALMYGSAAFATDVSNGVFAKFSVSEVDVVLALPAFIARMIVQKRISTNGPLAVPVLLYLGICVYSSCIHWLGQEALISLLQMVLYLIIVVALFSQYVQSPQRLYLPLFGLVAAGTLDAVIGMATDYRFLDQNKNGMGDIISSTLLVTVILWLATKPEQRIRKWMLSGSLVILTPSLVFSLSRGSWLAAISGLIMIFLLRREFKTLLRLLLVLVPIAVICWLSLPQDLQSYSVGFGQDRYNIQARYNSVDIAASYFDQNPVYGMGVGLRKMYDATNTPLMTLAETGVLGFVAFLLIHGVFYRMVWWTDKRLKKSDSLHPLLCVGATLVLARFMHGLVDHYWTRGVLMTTWGGAGMTIAAYYVVYCRPTRGARVLKPDAGAVAVPNSAR